MDVNDPRAPLWVERRDMQNRLALHRLLMRATCGCERCGNGERLLNLAGLIRADVDAIAELSDQITDGVRVPQPYLVGEDGPEIMVLPKLT